MSAPTYAIKNVWDFLKVPAKRRKVCLREFAIALEMAEATKRLLHATADALELSQVRFDVTDTFTWIDDRKRTATIHIAGTPSP